MIEDRYLADFLVALKFSMAKKTNSIAVCCLGEQVHYLCRYAMKATSSVYSLIQAHCAGRTAWSSPRPDFMKLASCWKWLELLSKTVTASFAIFWFPIK